MVEATVGHIRAQCLPFGFSPTQCEEGGDCGRSVQHVVDFCQQTSFRDSSTTGFLAEKTSKE